MSDIVETSKYDELTDKMIVKTTYDNTDVLELNKQERNERPESNKYKGNMVHVGRIHMGDITRLANIGYNLLSPDRDEVKRALLYIQSNEPWLLTVDGKPFAKVRSKWA